MRVPVSTSSLMRALTSRSFLSGNKFTRVVKQGRYRLHSTTLASANFKSVHDQHATACGSSRSLSASPSYDEDIEGIKDDEMNALHSFESGEIPLGDLFRLYHGPGLNNGERHDVHSWVGRTGSIRRTFGPRSNAAAMLACGGEALSARTSWDPQYGRAVSWIRQHAVGPAVLSPILVTGLTGALVQAAFPHAIHVKQDMQQSRPLIVGVTVEAKMQVTHVTRVPRSHLQEDDDRGTLPASLEMQQDGHQVTLKTETTRASDGAVIASGTHVIWIPDYMNV